MDLKVGQEGLLIPKELLDGFEEFAVMKREGSALVIVPKAKTDPIWNLGKNPADGCEPDASVNFDRYRYGAGS